MALRGDISPANNFVRQCPACGQIWPLEDIVNSPEFEPLGFQVNTARPELALFFFVHSAGACHSTFVISNLELRRLLAVDRESVDTHSPLLCDGHYSHAYATPCREDCACRQHRALLEQLYAARRAVIAAVS